MHDSNSLQSKLIFPKYYLFFCLNFLLLCCVGVVDPGREPSPSNILAFVNCGTTWDSINCEGVQFMGEIFYITTKVIRTNVELLVYYGDDYAKKLNVDPAVIFFSSL